jgi:hypothetical protein
MTKITHKTARTIKPYPTIFKCHKFTVPKGSTVSNKTARGYDDNYRFWTSWKNFVEKLTDFKDSSLAHDLKYYGLNIPAEYCEAWHDTKPLPKPRAAMPATLP